MSAAGLTYLEAKHRRRLYKGRRWNRVRLQVLRRDNWTCTKCGSWGNVAHHVGGYGDLDSFHDPDNIRTVCGTCHAQIHSRRVSPRMRAEQAKWDLLVSQTIEHGS